MYTNQEVLQEWVNHNQRGTQHPHYRSVNLAFRGPILFSYGDPLACYHTGPTKRLYVLITKHRSKAGAGWGNRSHWANAHSHPTVPKFEVANINIENSPNVHEANVLQMYADLRNLDDERIGDFRWTEGKLPDHVASSMRNEHETICNYVACAGVDSEPRDIKARIEHVRYERMKRWYQYMDPKLVAKRERAAARKLAKELLGV